MVFMGRGFYGCGGKCQEESDLSFQSSGFLAKARLVAWQTAVRSGIQPITDMQNSAEASPPRLHLMHVNDILPSSGIGE
jgi:hypothetical protein